MDYARRSRTGALPERDLPAGTRCELTRHVRSLLALRPRNDRRTTGHFLRWTQSLMPYVLPMWLFEFTSTETHVLQRLAAMASVVLCQIDRELEQIK